MDGFVGGLGGSHVNGVNSDTEACGCSHFSDGGGRRGCGWEWWVWWKWDVG